MRRLTTILAFLALAVGAAAPGRCGEREDLRRENLLLQAELGLAKTGKLYAVFDLPRLQVLIKSKGIVLRVIPITTLSVWGDQVGDAPAALLWRGSLSPPARPQLKPGDASYTPASAKPNAEPEVLELKDMPTEYSLVLQGGMVMSVQNKVTGFGPRFRRFWSDLTWALGRPLATLSHAYRRTPYTAVRLVLEGPEAQALYWVLSEGTQSFILDPGK